VSLRAASSGAAQLRLRPGRVRLEEHEMSILRKLAEHGGKVPPDLIKH
jgi:hypothetical protein